jgi:hypothetical protein
VAFSENLVLINIDQTNTRVMRMGCLKMIKQSYQLVFGEELYINIVVGSILSTEKTVQHHRKI